MLVRGASAGRPRARRLSDIIDDDYSEDHAAASSSARAAAAAAAGASRKKKDDRKSISLLRKLAPVIEDAFPKQPKSKACKKSQVSTTTWKGCGASSTDPDITLDGTAETTILSHSIKCDSGEFGIILDGATLDCHGRSISGGSGGTAVTMRNGSVLKNCVINGFTFGIVIEVGGDNRVESVMVHNTNGVGIRIEDFASGAIVDSEVTGAGLDGMSTDGLTTIIQRSRFVNNNFYGIKDRGINGVTVIDRSAFVGNGSDGYFQSNSATNDLTITGSTFHFNAGFGIDAAGTSSKVISDVVSSNNGVDGIEIEHEEVDKNLELSNLVTEHNGRDGLKLNLAVGADVPKIDGQIVTCNNRFDLLSEDPDGLISDWTNGDVTTTCGTTSGTNSPTSCDNQCDVGGTRNVVKEGVQEVICE